MGLNSPSSEMNTGAVSENFGWDPIVSLSQSENFGASSMAANNGVYGNADPSFVHYTSDPNAVFGGGSFSEMANPFGLPVCGQNYQMLEERALMGSPNGKRKRASETPPSNPNKTAECDLRRDISGETSELKESDEKRRKGEKNNSPNQSNKQTGKQVKDDAQDGEESKGDYVHMRARRGQATNSHSLAERVRREKISERMRLLQELVPGCNKITGKAVMLDEIINYVQSLQQQVEFLSMKLATVNPEVNLDIDRILSKDILHLRGGGIPVLGFNPGTSSSHPYTSGIHQGTIPGIPNTSAYHHTLPRGMWDGEMQGLLHMGFGLNPSVTHPGSDGSSKPEP